MHGRITANVKRSARPVSRVNDNNNGMHAGGGFLEYVLGFSFGHDLETETLIGGRILPHELPLGASRQRNEELVVAEGLRASHISA